MGSVSLHVVVFLQSLVSLAFALAGITTKQWLVEIGTSGQTETKGLPWMNLMGGTPLQKGILSMAILGPACIFLLLIINFFDMCRARSYCDGEEKRVPPLTFANSIFSFIALMSTLALVLIYYFSETKSASYLGYSFWFSVVGGVGFLYIGLTLTIAIIFSQ